MLVRMPETLWKRPATVDEINRLSQGTLVSHADIRFTEVGPDFLRATMPVDRRTIQPAGLLHGGASCVLAETLGSIASLLCIEDTNAHPVGLEINASHLRAVTSGHVTGTVRPIRVGRKVHVWEIRIENEQRQLTCLSRLTVTVVSKRSP